MVNNDPRRSVLPIDHVRGRFSILLARNFLRTSRTSLTLRASIVVLVTMHSYAHASADASARAFAEIPAETSSEASTHDHPKPVVLAPGYVDLQFTPPAVGSYDLPAIGAAGDGSSGVRLRVSGGKWQPQYRLDGPRPNDGCRSTLPLGRDQ